VEGTEREGPKLLLNQAPSEPCYATVPLSALRSSPLLPPPHAHSKISCDGVVCRASVGTCTMEDMIITDVENLRELTELQQLRDDRRSTGRRHRAPSSEHDEQRRGGAQSAANTPSGSWVNHRASSRHARRTSSSSCPREQSTSSERPDRQVSLCRCYK